ncbi:MAG: hypothetical protein HOP33_21630 [Verrucomicrobia bacterium]|nr:hypothetical protein [Verrucomicrobiota bacterium]
MSSALVTLFVVLLGIIGRAEDRPHYDACELTGRLRDTAQTSFVVRIQSSPFATNTTVAISRWWGRDGSNPERVTARLSLCVGGREVGIPLRAFADLGEPNIPDGISLTQQADDLLLYVRGGDAGGSYIAKFTVHGGKLTRREVVPGEFPEFKPQIMRFD